MSFDEQLPFFVYGTLRHGEVNHFLLEGKTLSEQPAYADGLHLYSLGWYPLVLPAVEGDSRVVGEVITIKPESYEHLVRLLDQLEEYFPDDPVRSDYLRVPYSVTLHTGEPVRAWIYLGKTRNLAGWHRRIPDGDWVAYRKGQSGGG
jgi:gamma-glutamylcyclotransferase (GGCT)/AIG2-like uncharacterized protein YtfP